MNTYIAYFDETGDDGPTTASSDAFILTSLYMDTGRWRDNFEKIRQGRVELKEEFGFHTSEELHTKHLLTDKEPYRKYQWSPEQRREILRRFTLCVAGLDAKLVNVIIDKTKFRNLDYPVLENALKYNIQRIENDSRGEWKYLIITDQGRLAPMRKTARAIRAFNPIHSKFSGGYTNIPIQDLIEDILEKDSKESYFVQVCDFVSYMVHLYYKTRIKKEALPNRVGKVIDKAFIGSVMATLEEGQLLNTKASSRKYGLVIYPKA